ncbi:MAG: homoserine O-acetyltransferase [Bacillota bacterium]
MAIAAYRVSRVRRRDYDPPDSPTSVGYIRSSLARLADQENPLVLQCGRPFWPIDVTYETYGKLNSDRDNAILVCHALSGDAHAAGWDPDALEQGRPWRADRPGWWDSMIGPGKALDTNKYFVVCSNVLGSCYGTTGPSSTDPSSGKPYGSSFPVVTVGDWVRLEERLVTHLKIDKLKAVIGGSLGGQQALEWALAYPERVESAIVIGASARLSAQGLAFNAVGRYAIVNDPNFRGGDYYDGVPPRVGLSVARRLAHITYLSEESLEAKFGRRYRHGCGPSYGFSTEFEVESYLDHQGEKFVERFDANSYLCITRAMDYYDASDWGDGDLERALSRAKATFLLVSFSSDWLYTPAQMEQLALSLAKCEKRVTYVEIPSSAGHDAFLIETETLTEVVKAFLDGQTTKRLSPPLYSQIGL